MRLQEKMRELIERYYQHHSNRDSMLYRDLQNLQHDFAEEFKRYAPQEILNADFSIYTAYIHGLASGGIRTKLEDPLERHNTREWLSKSFFEWFPKYRFLESDRLNEYQSLEQELSLTNDWRARLIELIDLKSIEESSAVKEVIEVLKDINRQGLYVNRSASRPDGFYWNRT